MAKVLIRCKDCKHNGWVDTNSTYSNGHPLPTRQVTQNALSAALAKNEACVNHHITAHTVNGELNPEKACDARCLGATGPACSCECGGENHGGKYGAW